MKNYQTGYFADTTSWTKVHLVDEKHHPLCKANVSKTKQFQWCAHGVMPSMLECETCKKLAKILKY